MNTRKFFTGKGIGFLIVAIAISLFFIFKKDDNQEVVVIEKGIVEEYVRENIATLAPEDEVLGGTWYVTEISIDEDTDTGEVVYEDGHIQKSFSFSYFIAKDGTVGIENIEK